jgi:hypothetical protein
MSLVAADLPWLVYGFHWSSLFPGSSIVPVVGMVPPNKLTLLNNQHSTSGGWTGLLVLRPQGLLSPPLGTWSSQMPTFNYTTIHTFLYQFILSFNKYCKFKSYFGLVVLVKNNGKLGQMKVKVKFKGMLQN